MKHPTLLVLAFCTALAVCGADPAPAPAPAPTPDPAARQAALQKIADGITYRKGDTVLGKNLAKISVPEQFRYLDAKDTGTVLSSLWGNPKSDLSRKL